MEPGASVPDASKPGALSKSESLSLIRIAGLTGGLGILLVAITFAIASYGEYRRGFAAAAAETATQAHFLADHAGRLFEVSDVSLAAATNLLGDADWDQIGASRDLQARLRTMSKITPYIEDFWFNDQTGLLRITSFAFPTPFSDASDRSSFIAAKLPGDDLFVGDLIIGKVTKRPTFLVSKRIETPDGAFRGMASVTADIGYFTDYWKGLSLPLDARLTLFRADSFSILARYPATDDGVVTVGPGIQSAIATKVREGVVDGRFEGDRFGSFQRVGKLPLYLSVDISKDAVRAQWESWLMGRIPLAVLALMAFGALVLLAIRQARVEARARAMIEGAREALIRTNEELRSEIANREATEEQLRQSQKLEAIGQLTGGLAHDLNNMLAIIVGSLGMIERRIAKGSTDVAKFVDSAQEGARRATTLTQRLLAFARRQPLAPQVVDVNRFVSDLADLLRRTLTESIQVEIVLGGGIWKTHIDPGQLESALVNLAVNARDAMPEGGKLTIETANASLDPDYAARHSDVPPGQYILISVTDNGSGMPPAAVARAFEPFFTTKPVGRGTGLGLSQVYGFVRQSKGHVKIYSELGQGTTIKLYLPRHYGSEQEQRSRTQELDAIPAGAAGKQILVVEDEATVRRLSVDSLRELGYAVLEADGAANALAILQERRDVDLLFTDIVMPGMNGRVLAERAVALHPNLRVLFTTGYTRNAVVHNGVLDPGVQMLTKPYTLQQLASSIATALDG